MRFTNTITVRRPPSAVFSYLADLENLPEWNYALAETRKVTPGPVGVGSRYLQRRPVPRPAEETLQITEFVPGERLALQGTLNSFPAEVSYALHATDGGTTVINTVELELPGPRRLLSGVVAGRIKAAVAENLSVLAELLNR
jgi:uncharacterized protein YndB with AHSA1/START domain